MWKRLVAISEDSSKILGLIVAVATVGGLAWGGYAYLVQATSLDLSGDWRITDTFVTENGSKLEIAFDVTFEQGDQRTLFDGTGSKTCVNGSPTQKSEKSFITIAARVQRGSVTADFEETIRPHPPVKGSFDWDKVGDDRLEGRINANSGHSGDSVATRIPGVGSGCG